MPLVYGELHRLARRYMAGERPGHTLQTTALVNEAYLRLVDVKKVSWQSRSHFLGVSAQLMRRILVDLARSRQSLKRGGDVCTLSLEEALIVSPELGADVVALDDSLTALASIDPRRSRVVELRFFGQALCDVQGTVVGGSWNREDVIVFADSARGLMQVSASGGVASPLTTFDPSRRQPRVTMLSSPPSRRTEHMLRRSRRMPRAVRACGFVTSRPAQTNSSL
jgi:RNA polymerase sigma factor (TIGR02999 family)